MNIIKSNLILIFALWGTLSFAQKEYTLQECIDATLSNNLQIKNNQLDVKSINSQINESKSSFLPSVDLKGQYQYYFTIPSMLVPAEMFGGKPGEYSAISFNSKQTSVGSVEVSQLLFNQKVFIALKAAKTAKSITELQLSKTREDLVYNVSAVYYNIQVINQNISLLDSNILSMEKMLKINSVLQTNNIISKSTLNRLQINYENLKNERQNLSLLTEKTTNLLKFLMGKPMSEMIQVAKFQLEDKKPELTEVNVANRSDLLLLNKQIEVADLQKKIAKADFYPTLAGVYNYGFTGYNNTFSLTNTLNDTWMKGSYVALQLKIPIFSGFSRLEKVKQKEFEVQKAKNNYELVKQTALKEVSDATKNYYSMMNSFENTQRSLKLAIELFQNADTEYKNGLISVSDLLQIQNELTAARNNYSNAIINMKLAEIELYKSKGELVINK